MWAYFLLQVYVRIVVTICWALCLVERAVFRNCFLFFFCFLWDWFQSKERKMSSFGCFLKWPVSKSFPPSLVSCRCESWPMRFFSRGVYPQTRDASLGWGEPCWGKSALLARAIFTLSELCCYTSGWPLWWWVIVKKNNNWLRGWFLGVHYHSALACCPIDRVSTRLSPCKNELRVTIAGPPLYASNSWLRSLFAPAQKERVNNIRSARRGTGYQVPFYSVRNHMSNFGLYFISYKKTTQSLDLSRPGYHMIRILIRSRRRTQL